METAHNLILMGGTGTGKSYLVTAIGEAASGLLRVRSHTKEFMEGVRHAFP